MISEPIQKIHDNITIVEGVSGDGGERNRGYLVGKDTFTIINTGRRGTIENTFQEAIFNKGKDVKDVKRVRINTMHCPQAVEKHRSIEFFLKGTFLCSRFFNGSQPLCPLP